MHRDKKIKKLSLEKYIERILEMFDMKNLKMDLSNFFDMKALGLT